MRVMTDKELNFFFFGDGIHDLDFRKGQQIVPEWRSRSQLDVLIERVLEGALPLAEYYVQEHEDIDDVATAVNAAGLAAAAFYDEFGDEMIRFAANPDTKLRDLVSCTELLPFEKVEPHLDEILELQIGDYLGDGNEGRACSTPLEHAMVHGYSLNKALAQYLSP
mmetsp:Transcript_24628/g.64202  ORF Transcript_24628/g.64202 Transcript_24628/m.64202 type:complete len:165 (-) Transcript_24628:64-558(-)|eukprot:CAMPEP_0182929060 /NCGR_PEP_ID=MMETSP0105_2-20130417/19430_1 /TAXON_ID=81532 ORGANISM="Acanthoeca-like sp., Strain 10tr" /NCGR_SAMPLE_ID=MMETSP0105_2 /ASSEMBLY_ACC=CAM_ASM_000205 /LENGTH=164 /DNA_ID=CAMNT_0025067151 /DNA_START=76 /DNA_END=570 /DNA_ORIENTATION=-